MNGDMHNGGQGRLFTNIIKGCNGMLKLQAISQFRIQEFENGNSTCPQRFAGLNNIWSSGQANQRKCIPLTSPWPEKRSSCTSTASAKFASYNAFFQTTFCLAPVIEVIATEK
eukprot:1143293-Pelagomonas_calceolata.AAC.2